MGVAESKIQLKTHFNELITTNDIKESDSVWNFLLSTPVESRELSSLVPARDVRELKERHPENFEMLLKVSIKRLIQATRLSAVGTSSEQPLLSSIRVLTRVLPFVYEGDMAWSVNYLWQSELGRDLLDTIVKLFTYPGFTVDSDQQIWTQGVGSALDYRPSAKILENRIEILRLLLATLCQPLYSVDTPYALDYMVSSLPKKQATLIFCSLFNTSLAHSRSIWNKPFQEEVIQTAHAKVAVLSQQAFLALIVHVNSQGRPNRFRKLLSKIHLEDDISFIVDRLVIKADSNAQNLMLIWDCVQANQAILTKLEGAPLQELTKKLVDLLLGNLTTPAQELPRIASYLLLFLSSQTTLAPAMADETIRLAVPTFSPHTGVILRVLYNCCPFWAHLDTAAASELTHFLKEVVDKGTVKQSEWAVKLVKQCLQSLQERAKPLAYEIAQVNWPSKQAALWFSNYAREVNSTQPPPSTFEAVRLPRLANPENHHPVSFDWSADRLRWYASVVWSEIFQYDQQAFAPGIWTGTYIELFKIEKVTAKPSIRRPRGAVDAVADAVAERAKNWIFK